MQNLTQKLTLLTLILLAFSLCAAAQTTSNVAGVTLSGPVANPIIENHSGKAVLWVRFKRLISQDADAREGGQWFIDQAGGLPDGASAKLQRYNNKNNTVISAAISAVIFEDGEFRGENKDPMRYSVEITFMLMREAWQMAQAGEWDKLQAKADKVEDGLLPALAAKLLQARGDDTAMAALAFLGNLPASTWTGGAAKLRQIPNFLQALPSLPFALLQGTLRADNPPWFSSSINPYPQSGTDAWRSTQWVYNCVDYVIGQSPNPCPALGGNSTVGATAVWTRHQGKWRTVSYQFG